MKKKKIIILFFILISVSFSINSLEKRTALIIGNSNYKAGFLKNPVNDAKLMSSTLKSLGFDVIIKLDIPDQNEMKKIIRKFGAIIKSKGGVALFYYAGHGIQIQSVNYLVPIKANINKEEDVEYECVQVDMIFSELQYAESKTNIVILDACRNNPFARSFRSSTDRGLAVISKSPSGTIIAFATAPGNIAIDGYGNNGLYTEELVKCMTIPNVDILKMFMQVRNNVAKRSNNQQVPWENSSLFNEFYFVKKEGVDSTTTTVKKETKKITIEEEVLYGSIQIEVLENGKLYIDNKFISNVTGGKKITLNNITVGNHDVEIRYDDKTESKNVFVEKNKIIALSFSYRKQERLKLPDNFVFV